MCYNRFRYYRPETGRYISEDPIKLLGGFNIFAYVGDTNAWVDLLGLETILLNTKDINFSQTTINKNFDTPEGKTNFQSEVNRLKEARKEAAKENKKFIPEYPPIEVAIVKGQYVVIDGNSRLAAARSAKIERINATIVTDREKLIDLTSRLKNNGTGKEGTSKLPTCKG